MCLLVLVIIDVCLLGLDGLVLFDEVWVCYLFLFVILFMVYGSIFDVVEVMMCGVYVYLIKFFDGKELMDKIG